ncbi:unnamed protein product [Haemonchus placei]|uniref:Uncharacterized protein n=1 Tax=Haemonchus placei TaxID=6290 RepID=A0A3P7VA85_HAEPC|nr:unnamed protein product [Haemonchus placei]
MSQFRCSNGIRAFRSIIAREQGIKQVFMCGYTTMSGQFSSYFVLHARYSQLWQVEQFQSNLHIILTCYIDLQINWMWLSHYFFVQFKAISHNTMSFIIVTGFFIVASFLLLNLLLLPSSQAQRFTCISTNYHL